MDLLNLVLPVLMYCVGIILIVVLIILGIKLIMMLDKMDKVVDNVNDKLNSLNAIFSFVDRTTDSLAMISDTVINSIASFVYKMFKNKKKKRKNVEEEFEDE